METKAHSEITRPGPYRGLRIMYDKREDDGGPHTPETCCTYCGSISPSRLLELIKAGTATIELADMKYGWPHKLYVTVPNAKAGEPCRIVSQFGKEDDPELNAKYLHKRPYHPEKPDENWQFWNADPAPQTKSIKFYTEHLADATDAEFEELSAHLQVRVNVLFKRDAEGRLMFSFGGR